MLYILGAIATALTFAMFHTRQMMLGFPCVIFWAILGGYCYGNTVYDWDIYYFLFFASAFGMTIFCALSAFALRERKDTETDKDEYIDEGEDDLKYIDEEKSEEESGVSKRTRAVRDRAKKRRSGESRSSRL